MAQLGFTIAPEDAREPSFEGVSTPVPADWYDAKIHSAELKCNKDDYYYINIRYDITGPRYAGRCVYSNIGLSHPTSGKVAEIGKDKLAQIAAALNKRISDTDDLVNGQLRIKVVVTPATAKYGEGNDVTNWGLSSSAIPASQSGLVGASAPKSGTNPPWVK